MVVWSFLFAQDDALSRTTARAMATWLLLPAVTMALSSAACSSGSTEHVALGLETPSEAVPILYGSPDTNPEHDAVVAVNSGGTAGWCSGTLIAQRVVLTAGHCIGREVRDMYVLFGKDIEGTVTKVQVTQARVHPDYDHLAGLVMANDIALIRLAADPPAGVKPFSYLPARLKLGDADVSRQVELVGFGMNEDWVYGEKLRGEVTIACVCASPSNCECETPSGKSFQAFENTFCHAINPIGICRGDSGGPAFILRNGTKHVAGVASYVDADPSNPSTFCRIFGCHTSVHGFESLIEDFAGASLGSDCQNDDACALGMCVDGVCCDSPCDDACKACNLPDRLGHCDAVPDATACPDDDLCDGQEVCIGGTCSDGEPLVCPGGDPCLTANCEPAVGCVPVPDGTSCADEDLCNGQESCHAGQCQAGAPLVCDDFNECTEDACVRSQGCVAMAIPDETPCGGGTCGPGICSQGMCALEDPSVCIDGDPCTRDACHPEHGCINETAAPGTSCGPCMICAGNACVFDQECSVFGGAGCFVGGTGPNRSLPGVAALAAALLLAGVRRRRRS